MRTSKPHMAERRFPKGTTLFVEGDQSRELYVLVGGSVRVTKNGAEIATIGDPGVYFGEISALLGTPRTATVVTAEDSLMLVVPPDRMVELFGQTPELGLRLARILAARLSATTKELAECRDWFVAEKGVVGS